MSGNDTVNMQRQVINFIGCGRAAGSLAQLWIQADCVAIGGVLNRSRNSTQRAVDKLGSGTVMSSLQSFDSAHYWLIGTSDEQIEPAAKALSETSIDLSGSFVFHLCGRHGTGILAPLEDRGCEIAAIHPVRSLTHERLSLEDFEGTACVAEGSEEALRALHALFQSIGGVWLPVRDIERGLYHASVSIISNVTKAVAWKAQNWLVSAGLDPEMAVTVTQKLLSSTLEDVSRSGARQSITGPVVRGDSSTIEAHLKALATGHPEDVDVYRVLARTVLELARERGDLNAETLARFEALLGGSEPVQGGPAERN